MAKSVRPKLTLQIHERNLGHAHSYLMWRLDRSRPIGFPSAAKAYKTVVAPHWAHYFDGKAGTGESRPAYSAIEPVPAEEASLEGLA